MIVILGKRAKEFLNYNHLRIECVFTERQVAICVQLANMKGIVRWYCGFAGMSYVLMKWLLLLSV